MGAGLARRRKRPEPIVPYCPTDRPAGYPFTGAGERHPLSGGERQLRPVGVLRVAHRDYARHAARDLDALTAVVAVRTLSPHGGDLDALAAVVAVGALPPCSTGQVQVIHGGHPAPPWVGNPVRSFATRVVMRRDSSGSSAFAISFLNIRA